MRKALIILSIPIVILSIYFSCKFYNSYKNTMTVKQVLPVITAIDSYITKNKKFPTSLNDLVPEFIDKLPVTSKNINYKVHGKYYLISFLHESILFGYWYTYNVYWSKTKKWYISDFTEWPEE